ncbi:MAG: hypothetical protein RJA33_443 [Actinomycetota bacterium]|jgi:signal peptidase I
MSTNRRVRGITTTVTLLLIAIFTPVILTTQFGVGFSPILTGSMAPEANAGDLYLTRVTEASSLAVNDVIAVNNPATGVYYSHRVVEIRNLNGLLRFTTKGDANSNADRDPFITSPSGDVSRVVFRIPFLGRPMVYMNTVEGRQSAATLLVVANLLALFVFLFRKKIVASLIPERVYKELYTEERRNSQQYRSLIDSLQESLAIERENNQEVGARK